MGDCASKLRSSRTGGQHLLTGIDTDRKNTTPSISTTTNNDEQLDMKIANIRQLRYWQRRLVKICGLESGNSVSVEEFGRFFQYSGLSKETLNGLFEGFKNKKEVLTKQAFIEEMKKIASVSDLELSTVVYSLYFYDVSKGQASLATFQSQFKPFVKGGQEDSYNLRVSREKDAYPNKIKQLAGLLEKRKTQTDSAPTIKWLTKNLRFKEFKSQLLQGGIKIDEIAAFKQFWSDYGQNSSRLSGVEFQEPPTALVKIINWRWCEKMLKYLQQKYQIEGAFKLKRKQTIDLESPAFKTLKTRKSSIDLQNSKIPNFNNSNFYQSYYSNRNSGSKSLTNGIIGLQNIPMTRNSSIKDQPIKIAERTVGSGLQFRNHPGQIDNYALLGNFQWQLKRNIRKEVDYITIKQQTFDKLVMAFGGGPVLERRIIQGYIQLRPYFINTFFFEADIKANRGELVNSQLVKFAPSDPVSSVSLGAYGLGNGGNVGYHRNVGEEWRKIQGAVLGGGEKIMDTLSETSFLVYMPASAEQTFKRIYTSKYKTPKIGQKYTSTTYRIFESASQRTLSSEPINICIVRDQKKNLIEFIVLNWQHHLKRTITLPEFQQYFKIVEGTGIRDSGQNKNRSGIANLGNTCYMNSILQALLSTFREEEVMGMKGELGVQLRHIYKLMVEKKKNVFPVDFKTVFDRYYQSFQGQDQHDAHQFCICLFQQLQKDNPSLIPDTFRSQHILKTTCHKCLKQQQSLQHCSIVTLPLRDFAKKEVKIDYIIDNKSIQTVVFTIDENSTVEQWRNAFQKASGARVGEYYLCEVQGSVIRRSFNKEDGLDGLLYEDMNIENHFLITAYSSQTYNTNTKLQTKHDFRSYKSLNSNTITIARVQSPQSQMAIKSTNELPDEIKLKIKVPVGNEFEQKIVKQQQLRPFPQQYPIRELYVKIVNYDGTYGECIGRPFVFRIPSHYPLSTLRQALEKCIGKGGYTLRICRFNQFSKCQICKKYNENTSKCFIEKQKTAPLCWVDGILEFVAVWQDSREYQKLIQRQKYTPNTLQTQSQKQQFDNFDISLRSLMEPEIVSDMVCDNCHMKKVQCQRKVQIKKWPKALIIHLMRFKRTTQTMKIHTKWHLQQSLQIGPIKYTLRAVLCHLGHSGDYGHYVTVSDGYCYDDELVTEMGYGGIKPEEVYMMFYRRVD